MTAAAKKRTKRIYELYDGPKVFSPQSKYYGQYSKNIYRVRAVSLKQAMYLLYQDQYAESNKHVGIVVVWREGDVRC